MVKLVIKLFKINVNISFFYAKISNIIAMFK
jgi:hypothetical protein